MPHTHIMKFVVAPVFGVVTGAVTSTMTVIDQNTHVPIGVACTIGIAVAGFVWWAAAALQKINDRLGSMEKHMKRLPCNPEKVENPACPDPAEP